MANSRFAYVRTYELPDPMLPGTFPIFRLDGHSFHRFSDVHGFAKPNDPRALQLMDRAARELIAKYPDIVLAFGESDEYSFLLRKQTTLYNRRQTKIVSTLTSYFTSCYVFHWPTYFPDTSLTYPPSFDGRIVLYPSEREVRDYFAWRQADTHINNLYNTAFWALVQQGGETTTQAHAILRGTVSKEKHEILFSRFKINYNDIDERFKKGSVLVREEITSSLAEGQHAEDSASHPSDQPPSSDKNASHVTREFGGENLLGDKQQQEPQSQPILQMPKQGTASKREKKRKAAVNPLTKIELLHCDIIKDTFWEMRPLLLLS